MNYRDATIEETVDKVLTSSKQSVQMAKRYYQSIGEDGVVAKIDKARKLAKIEKIKAEIRSQEDVNDTED